VTATGDLEVDDLLEVLEEMHAEEAGDPGEGLRERKKRRLRQKISDVATAMFVVHGFDNVSVARIAAACEISEQTVFNYFPTKESMFLDRSQSMGAAVAEAVSERGSASLVEAVVRALGGGIQPRKQKSSDEARQLRLSRLFGEVATGSPTLAAARLAEFARFTDELSVALAHRIGADPIDPEVQLAAQLVGGLVRVRLQSTFRHVQKAKSFAALNKAVHRDILRAAAVAEPSLAAFDNMRSRTDG
jgi:AcrR family transcriptional regulator